MTRIGLGILLMLCVSAALAVGSTFLKAADQLERHVTARPENIETAARMGAETGGGVFVRAHKKISSRLLSSGSEGAL